MVSVVKNELNYMNRKGNYKNNNNKVFLLLLQTSFIKASKLCSKDYTVVLQGKCLSYLLLFLEEQVAELNSGYITSYNFPNTV